MRTRVNRLRGEGVAVARFYVGKDESFILGKKPNHEEQYVDDFQPVLESRFLVKGKTLTRNTFNEYTVTEADPIPEKGNPRWAEVIALEETIGICMSTTNPKHRVRKPHRLKIGPNEETIVEFAGYLAVVDGQATLNGAEIKDMELVRLRGNEVTIKAGDKGCDIAALDIDFLNA